MSYRNILTLFFTLTIILSFSSSVYAEKILIIQTIPTMPYKRALKGFRESCNCNILKKVFQVRAHKNLQKDIYEQKPDRLVVMGTPAVQMVSNAIDDLPILAMMADDLAPEITARSNIDHVVVNLPPEKQVLAFLEVIPGLRKIGILYTEKDSGHIVRSAQRALTTKETRLIPKVLANANELPLKIRDIREEIDGLWVTPDSASKEPLLVKHIILHSMHFHFPILSTGWLYAEIGAAVSVDLDPYYISEEVSYILNEKLLSAKKKGIEKEVPRSFVIDAKRARIFINQTVVKNINLKIAEKYKGAKYSSLDIRNLK